MGYVALALLGIGAFGVWSVAGALQRIAGHNEKFPVPDPPSGFRLNEGDVLLVSFPALNAEQVFTVKGLGLADDGLLTARVEPLGT